MKNIFKKIMFASIAILSFTACDLDREPETILSDAVFWTSETQFREATNYLYKSVAVAPSSIDKGGILVEDVMGGDEYLNDGNDVSSGTHIATSKFGPWDVNYKTIRAANNILEKAVTSGLEGDAINRYIGVAKFFRAYAYANLIRRYGDVPLITKTLQVDSEELYAAKAPVEEVVALIYSDLDFAAANIPDVNGVSHGSISSGAALLLKSRVALRRGTWNKFHGGADAATHLQTAKAAANQLIVNGNYTLFTSSDVIQMFKFDGEGDANPETIWAWQYGTDDSGITVGGTNTYGPIINNDRIAATKSLVDAYLCTDGLPIDQSPLYAGRTSAFSEFTNRDPRLNAVVIKPGDSERGNLFYEPNLANFTGYKLNKYLAYLIDGSRSYYIDVMAYRYAEALLNYAEATYELGDAITNEDLDKSINVLRDRVSMPHLSNEFVAANGLDMQKEIRRERRAELSIEGFRYDDLLRWKTAETEMLKPILGVRFFAAEYPNDDGSGLTFTTVDGEDNIIVIEDASTRFFDPAKHYLWPLPLNQIGLNPNLIQNPGW